MATSAASKGETPPRPPSKRARPTDYGFDNQPDFNDASASDSETGPIRKVTRRVNGTESEPSGKRRSTGGNKLFSSVVKLNGVRVKSTAAQRAAMVKTKSRRGSDGESEKDEKEDVEDEGEQVPFGGLIDGPLAETTRSQLAEVDRRFFAETAAQATYEVRRSRPSHVLVERATDNAPALLPHPCRSPRTAFFATNRPSQRVPAVGDKTTTTATATMIHSV